ncbi:mitogen-activated protein kinase kinase kinase 17-like [Macadamia integrifolia]|uniref:mitogen-activated protein kinase kinase kinase 17-like n=1 Tax=Macadamia integrifolia TaxID=60698 RepID=UPI001C4F94B7|nr:mitogen-activated protein kinase kinase kinase 17-like [Macadamia integrifolia]
MEKKSSIVSRRQPQWVRSNCIGKGSFGTVSLASVVSDGRVFAVKSVNLNSSLTSHQLESLENEIRTLRSLSSPFVVQYLGDDLTHESGNVSYRNLLMEYLGGCTAADVASQFGGKGLERVVRSCTRCIVSALTYVHGMGFVHCDVKGKNVLLGSGPTPSVAAKLADFGSAKRFYSEKEEEENERMILPRGSPLWMAPEVIRGEKQGPESDVWSLGCTIIEMIRGKPAWEDCGADTLCRIAFSDAVPDFPAELSVLGRDFLENCLRREPSERWTCQQLLHHPFVSVGVVTDSSPRSILEWSTSEFTDDEHDEEEEESDFGFNGYGDKTDSQNSNSNSGRLVIPAKEIIRELNTGGGVIWESDGWELVRSSGLVCNRGVAETASDGVNEEVRRRTSLEFSELRSVIEEKVGISSEAGRIARELESEGSEGTSSVYLDSVTGPFTHRYVIESQWAPSYVRTCAMRAKALYSCTKFVFVNCLLMIFRFYLLFIIF